ncbi:uncharacterized protein LOC134255386 [Saccostrea cucullata]|uniref:uncharacterized protein LOC134255386 n=1 Tax=Saccostrea cuccullata TaxID=36930 RepID=UPI002ED38CFA
MRTWVIILYSQCIIFVYSKDSVVSDTAAENGKEKNDRIKSLKFSHPVGRREQGDALKSKLNIGRRNRFAETLFTRQLGRTKNWKQKDSGTMQNQTYKKEESSLSKNLKLTTPKAKGVENLSKNDTQKNYDPPESNVDKDTASQFFPSVNNSKPKGTYIRLRRKNWRKFRAIQRKIQEKLRRNIMKMFGKRTDGPM